MAFTTQDRPRGMPAPGEKSPTVVAIGIGKPKNGADTPPDDPNGGGDKHELESAGVIREDKHCKACENYDPSSGDCAKLPGSFSPDDACLKHFEAIGDDESAEAPDADDSATSPMGGAPPDAMAQ